MNKKLKLLFKQELNKFLKKVLFWLVIVGIILLIHLK